VSGKQGQQSQWDAVGEVWAMMPGDDVLTMPIARRIEMFTHYLR
jgi:hypothetical protein